ncbi:DUF6262 family protein [Baekduia alba]|uniref:DUF6262 family protein n=1 Tax=Baekduia alba TaxID=2997333 RepID=UPI0023402707|nr:DUF6262 family protein [Baekduia alba]
MTAAALHTSRRLDSQLKTQRVHAAVDAFIAAGRPVTIAQVAREASVSRKFIYSHPELRAEIEHRAAQATTRQTNSLTATARVSAASLRADLENHRALAHRQRRQIAALERRLSELLGRQVSDQMPYSDPVAAAEARLRERLQAAEQRAFELQESLATAHEELAAAREINRELSPRTTDPAPERPGRRPCSGGCRRSRRRPEQASMRRTKPSTDLTNSVTAASASPHETPRFFKQLSSSAGDPIERRRWKRSRTRIGRLDATAYRRSFITQPRPTRFPLMRSIERPS